MADEYLESGTLSMDYLLKIAILALVYVVILVLGGLMLISFLEGQS